MKIELKKIKISEVTKNYIDNAEEGVIGYGGPKSRFEEPFYPGTETGTCYFCKSECWLSSVGETLSELRPNFTAICYDCAKKIREELK